MNGCTVNIADFRCRAVARTSADRLSRRLHGFKIVDTDASSRERGMELLQEAVLQEDPTVYDIGIAREAQRLRHRTVFRPINIQRKAKVLRFRDELPMQLTVRVDDGRNREAWPGMPDGPYDFPPAA